MTAQKVPDDEKSTHDKPRRPGRPRGGAITAQQREHLLDITLALYAESGIAETSLNAIARKAGVSPAMLNYYFQSRESLLDVVVEERFLPLRQRLEAHFDHESSDPVATFSGFIREIADIVMSNDWFAQLWMQEVTGGSHGLGQHIKARYGHAGRDKVRAIMVRWQQQGLLNAELNPDLLMTSILSMILVPFSRFANEPEFNTEIIVQHTLSLFCQGIRPVS
ncbi:TetR family transcriptional regulator [Pantoea rodasii]|uniref:TetR family transcriptional regulator n=1 Tax=Pantoea rodasii TaxID=1076549 RepID=A0A2M9W6S0_9GAMM|nr:TetR/AcrR family transcriptional regulator [Pantoea rodasii]ORM65504.1 TetR family transcriptional regulator [Pantoea rodasii]PJZ03235.1 TetR family transcriptional regulator [Pantoea rodasii]